MPPLPGPLVRSTRGRIGRSRAPATLTVTANPTSCGRAKMARRRFGSWMARMPRLSAPSARSTREIKGTGDYNGDGKSDILWQGKDGTPAIWLMDGTDVLSISAAGSFNPGSDWHLII